MPSSSAKHLIQRIVSLTMFMESIDTTIINTAIPAMSKSLGVNPIDLKIALISYLLSLAVFIPISGWLADKFGVKRVFLTALGIFTLSSLWCGFASTLWELVIARTIQGFGGALMMPVGRLILVRTFARHELINATNRVVMIGALGPMLGPVLGGVITHNFSWRWIFWVNIPVGIGVIWLAWRYLINEAPRIVHPLDKSGFFLFGSGLAALTFGLSALSESSFHFTMSLFIIVIAIILLGLYSWHSHYKTHPIINISLLQFRTFRISVLSNFCVRLSFGGTPFLLPLLLQISLGYTPQLSGLLLAPIALGIMAAKTFTQPLLKKLGYKNILFINTILLGFSLWSFILINAQTSLYFVCLLTFIFGILSSIQYSSMNSLAYAEIPSDNLSAATSIMSANQQIAQSFGVALCAMLIRYFSAKISPALLLEKTIFYHSFFTIGVITMCSTLIFTRLLVTDGRQMIDKN